MSDTSTYTAYEESVKPKPETPFRVTYGWSNYDDFATLEEAIIFVLKWKRPAQWQRPGNAMLRDPGAIMDTREHEEDGWGYAIVLADEAAVAMRAAHKTLVQS
jgi:hypothetical protein